MNNVYIVSSVRTPVGKANRGSLAHVAPLDYTTAVFKGAVDRVKNLKLEDIEDLMIGCATPEAEQGMNMAMQVGQAAGLGDHITGVTINRFCASGLQAIAMAHQSIACGHAQVLAAGGCESMSLLTLGGNNFVANPALNKIFPNAYLNMGNTAEAVAKKYKVSRASQDKFSLASHDKALRAIDQGLFNNEIIPLDIDLNYYHEGQLKNRKFRFSTDEGPRAGSTLESLGKLPPVFSVGGSVTAASSSQMSDGAACSILVNEQFVEERNLVPQARLVGFAVAPVPAHLMGMGPVAAIPKVLKQTGLELKDIGLIELNEAFASQSIAVINELGLDPKIINVNGGAIALGHPLGCTGAKLTATLLHEMERRSLRYGMVTMCVGGGMGAAGIFENLKI
ncbi:acetyl-CoA C-acyltransferase [Lentisphaera profundi]|uniref:acetyl-CoA C-acyltransferase n=1 Tax=Lentisphaera profundi TaxID=1658616 RepID=A0ABY7VTI2_9BACT|nr:acetyl-CoA C-acyltransferase [Lentisphaera profundi]WDE97521.1 acetyl-CoA C-acyltransferase [Lentisphaera profundi]